jgi:leucyl-tRNA synthetase
MRKQFKRLGFSYDWDRELATCHPQYYRWEQKMFLEMLQKGLAYKKTSLVNWCPHDQTVLANEQVENGRCWRCGTEVVQQELDQWFLKITDYAEELLSGHDILNAGWPEPVLTMQKNWIGKSYGTEIQFALDGLNDTLTVFTTRPDTLFGATFMSVAPEHPLVKRLCFNLPNEKEVLDFVDRIGRQDKFKRTADDMEKEGIFTGGYAINPATGARIPIYAANFVLYEYGTGAVMAVPAHDQRDFEFADKYGIEKKVVIQPPDGVLNPATMTCAYTDAGTMVHCGPFDGTPSEEGKRKVTEWLAEKGVGKQTVNYRLRDWGISRQRFWGCPVPVIYCEDCGTVPVPEKDLPVVLPEDVTITGQDGSPWPTWKASSIAPVPPAASPHGATPTPSTLVESSWYMVRYCSPRFDKGPVDTTKANYWLPVDQYIGGIEHAVMHLIYSRFWYKVMRDLGYIQGDEPATNLLTQGMVTLETYRLDDGRGSTRKK